MYKLLFTTNPDNKNQVPVILDTTDVEITSVALSRGSVEGNSRALQADVTFDTSVDLPKQGQEHMLEVFLHVLTEEHTVPMMEFMTINSASELKEVWDMASVSGGHGDIHAVVVKTALHAPGTF